MIEIDWTDEGQVLSHMLSKCPIDLNELYGEGTNYELRFTAKMHSAPYFNEVKLVIMDRGEILYEAVDQL